MSLLFSTLRETLEKRARYQRTVAELRAMPWEVAHDLDLDKMQADRIARQAVYGRA